MAGRVLPKDWRRPENRREMFLRMYDFNLKFRAHTELAYLWLPAIADGLGLDMDQRAWLAWLQGNTQNPVSTLALLQAAPRAEHYEEAIRLWSEHYDELAWDTDRRHQKRHFATATRAWFEAHGSKPAQAWIHAGLLGWDEIWSLARSLPYMGRLSAWSLAEYHRLLLGEDVVPDASSFLFEDVAGSHSHRNGAAHVAGYDAVFWSKPEARETLDIDWLEDFADGLLAEARRRNPGNPDVCRFTLESALCEYKLWHKRGQRYANVYTDMGYARLKRAERYLGHRFELLWQARESLPDYLRLEHSPYDPGAVPAKQNQFLETGQPVMLHREHADMPSPLNYRIETGMMKPRRY